jgi:hypothetical protein
MARFWKGQRTSSARDQNSLSRAATLRPLRFRVCSDFTGGIASPLLVMDGVGPNLERMGNLTGRKLATAKHRKKNVRAFKRIYPYPGKFRRKGRSPHLHQSNNRTFRHLWRPRTRPFHQWGIPCRPAIDSFHTLDKAPRASTWGIQIQRSSTFRIGGNPLASGPFGASHIPTAHELDRSDELCRLDGSKGAGLLWPEPGAQRHEVEPRPKELRALSSSSNQLRPAFGCGAPSRSRPQKRLARGSCSPFMNLSRHFL